MITLTKLEADHILSVLQESYDLFSYYQEHAMCDQVLTADEIIRMCLCNNEIDVLIPDSVSSSSILPIKIE